MKKFNCLVALFGAGLFSLAVAADVPANAKLAPKAKQFVTLNSGDEPSSLDPHKVSGMIEMRIIRDLIEGLTNLDAKGKLVSGVAESWSSDDFKTWTFKLRKDAKWSNGDAVIANDFVYGWRRAVNPETASPYASYFDYAKVKNNRKIVKGELPPEALGIKAIDDHTLQIELTEAVPYFPGMTVLAPMYPVHKATVENHGNKWTDVEHYVGNGAYTLSEWVVNEKIALKRNPSYWDNDNTVIEKVTFKTIPDNSSAYRAYRAGELDITGVPLEQTAKARVEMADQLLRSPVIATSYLLVNFENDKYKDGKLAKALKLSIDRDIIVKNLLKDVGNLPAFTLTPPYISGADFTMPAWSTWTQDKRNDEALKAYAEAGYSKDNPAKIEALYTTNDGNKKLLIALQSMWKRTLGADVTIKNMEWKTFQSRMRSGDYELGRYAWFADYDEPSTFLNTLVSSSTNNEGKFANSEFDNVMAQAFKVKSDAERAKLYQRAEEIADENSAVIPLFHHARFTVKKPHLGGFYAVPMGIYATKNLFITE